MTGEAGRDQAPGEAVAGRPARRPPDKPAERPSLRGGKPAQNRELRAQGRETVRKLLDAGLAEFRERGFHRARVDDMVQQAGVSHGTFYLYFASKEDLFKALFQDALRDLEEVTGDFPVVTRDGAGRAALRKWVGQFIDAYVAHATVVRIIIQAAPIEEDVFSDGMRLLFSLSEAITTGMTVAVRDASGQQDHPELTATACLLMLQQVSYLISEDMPLPRDEMAARVAYIIYAAFSLPPWPD
jgi:AcrR family transcriptional regulator